LNCQRSTKEDWKFHVPKGLICYPFVNSGVIPEDLHHFYKLIPTNKAIRDCLPKPDLEEEDVDSVLTEFKK
jgi:hypothetical protein